MAGNTVKLEVPCRIFGRATSKEFTISFVSNWATKQYKELTEDALEVWKEAQLLRNGEKTMQDANQETFKRAEDLLERKFALVEDILTSNGYEYDAKFWDRNCDPNAVNDFIMQSVHKDVNPGGKKKAQMM